MEGLIPLVYRVIVEYKNGNNNRHEHHRDLLSSWLINSTESSSSMASVSYIRLPTGDSGHLQTSPFTLASSPSSSSSSSSSGVQYSPVRRRVAA
ncbi:uncharacterized protein LOC133802549 [Humulus lupulus]|uniref:uncharacterized protein LOC133802549 n=1 Tax=Humulus lupulus TaxID=3486 RepID=UPI002B40C72E|nr:uncharacterized protein LOC133802549 [Humulus lupulus]